MFGLSFWEIGIILAIALIVLGPSKLPDLAKSFGKALREFRKATEDFKSTMDDETYRNEIPQTKLPAETVSRPLSATTGPVDSIHEPVPPEAEIVQPPMVTPPAASAVESAVPNEAEKKV